MLRGKLSLVVLACIATFSCVSMCSASPKDRHLRRPPLARPIDARDWNVSFPLTQESPPDPSSTVPDGSPTSTCQSYSPCNIFYQYVSIFYWPTESQNTACLASMSSHPTSAFPSGLSPVSPSIYAIFPSIMASDGCNQVGKGYGPITTSFAPSDLLTIDIGGRSTNVFNFADLPCGPSGIDLTPGETYAPLISPPPFISDLDPAFSRCIPGYSQGVDPPTAIPTVLGGLPPPVPGPGRPARRDLGAHAHPHVAPWAPTKTAGPTHQGQL